MTQKSPAEKLQENWPSFAAFARSVGVPIGTAQQWRLRGSIPPEHFLEVVEAAERDGVQGVTTDSLVQLRKDGREWAAQKRKSKTTGADHVKPAA